MLSSSKRSEDRWPCINSSIQFFGSVEEQDSKIKDRFSRDLAGLFEHLQEGFDHLGAVEKAKCGLDGIAADIFLRIDMEKKVLLLDRLFKYCGINFHLFTALLEIMQRNFPAYDFVVPALQGYDLAREISRYIGVHEIECIYLKSNEDERLLMDWMLRGITLEKILEDTKAHYDCLGGLEMKRQQLGLGTEISMYCLAEKGEEEVLWMEVRIPASGSKRV